MGIERRQGVRISLTNDVLNVQMKAEKTYIPCQVNDLSGTGLGLTTNVLEDIPVGSYVKLNTDNPGEGFNIEAKIMWRSSALSASTTRHYGAILIQRHNTNDYKQVLSTLSKHAQPELPRRQSHPQKDITSLKDRTERRNANTIRLRLASEGQKIDDWVARHRLQRVMSTASTSKVMSGGTEKIMLGSNNYLGLSTHPAVVEAAINATEKYGVGAGSVRLLAGTIDLHQKLEEKLAEFIGTESCALYPSGYMANVAVLSTILCRDDAIFNDTLNHASIIDGCRASGASMQFYRHNDMENLARKLSRYPYEQPKIIVTDGVFSMDGDVAQLPEIIQLGKQNNAIVMVDDAHATGVLGINGRGTSEYYGLVEQPDITICTLSKGLGIIGGAVCGSKMLTKTLVHRSRPYIFTGALPPAVAAAGIAALDVIKHETYLINQLHKNRETLCHELRLMGYDVPETQSAIIPVIIGDEDKTNELAAVLDELGVLVSAVTPPAVSRGTCRLRVSVMATHTEDDILQAVKVFRVAGRRVRIIP